MITVEIQPQLEKDFRVIVQEFYNGDETAAVNEAIKMFIIKKPYQQDKKRKTGGI